MPTVSVTRHDDHRNGRGIVWTSTAGEWSGGDLGTTAAIQLAVRNRLTSTYVVYSGTIVQATATQQIRVDLASTDTQAFVTGGAVHDYHVRVEGGAATTRTQTVELGDFSVIAGLFATTD